MGSLTGQTPASDYGGLLNINAGNIVGLTNVLQQVTDGFGSPTPLQLSTIALNIIRSGYTFQLDGVAVTAQAVDINSMCQPNPIALGTGSITFTIGTTAERPNSPVNGMMRYNTDTSTFEVYEGGAWEMVATSGSAVFSVSGTPHRITITGTPSNPIVDIASDYVGQTSLTTLGTITTGVWNGTVVSPDFGGTGVANAITSHITLGGSLTTSGAFNSVFTMTGDTNVTFPTSGTLATTTGTVASIAGTTDRITISGTSTNPIIDIAATYVGQSSITTLGTIGTGVWQGTTISATYGGSGVSNPTAHGVLIAEGSSAFTPIVLGAGQVLIGTTASDPVAGAIGSGSGILVGNGSGTITVSNTGVLSNVATANQTTVSGATGNVTIGLASNAILPGTGGVTLPTGNTAARAGGAGTIRFNSQTVVFESTVDGATWLPINTSGGTVTSVSGTTNRITSTGGTTPVIDIAATYVGQTSITTLGTIGTGVWQGTAVAEIYGGTNQTTYALGDTLYASAANTLHKLSGNITSGIQYLAQTGTGAVSAAPVWTSISGGDITGAALSKTDDTNVTLTLSGTPTTALLRAAGIAAGWTGQLSLTRGGTNASLTASNGGIVYSTASALAILAGTATAGQMLQSGASTTPAWSTSTYPATNAINTLLYASSANVMAALATANSAVLVTSSTGVPAWSSTMTNGQIIIGSTGATPTAATISAGTGISITNAAGAITIAATSAGFTWTDATNATYTLVAQNGYITDRSGGVTYTLPASGALGDEIKIVGKLGLGTIAQNANQQIVASSAATTVGVTGSLVSTNLGDTITLICITAGASTVWRVDSFIGNWTYN